MKNSDDEKVGWGGLIMWKKEHFALCPRRLTETKGPELRLPEPGSALPSEKGAMETKIKDLDMWIEELSNGK